MMISMGEGTKRSLENLFSKTVGSFAANSVQMMNSMEVEDVCGSESATSSFEEDSTTSITSSSSSSDLREDASSSSSSNGPLYELSELMAQLPIKRGLSKYYQGKSQSFTSLSSVRCLDDFAKRESPCRKKMKPCKSYGGGLDTRKSFSPKAVISKKSSRGSASSLAKRGSFMGSCRPPLPLQRNQYI